MSTLHRSGGGGFAEGGNSRKRRRRAQSSGQRRQQRIQQPASRHVGGVRNEGGDGSADEFFVTGGSSRQRNLYLQTVVGQALHRSRRQQRRDAAEALLSYSGDELDGGHRDLSDRRNHYHVDSPASNEWVGLADAIAASLAEGQDHVQHQEGVVPHAGIDAAGDVGCIGGVTSSSDSSGSSDSSKQSTKQIALMADKCIICCDRWAQFIPGGGCGHLVYCESCIARIMGTTGRCAMCKTSFTTYVKIHC